MKHSMRIKILKQFPNPLTNRMAKVGHEMNVLPNIFWLKRINEKDCEQIKLKSKAAPKVGKDSNKKGSK